ncbi:ABC transporter ATP-binding protein [Saliphagus sp. GCM10025317]
MSSERTVSGDTTSHGSTDRILEASNLTVSYGEIKALRGVDLHIDENEIVSVIGPNGAGKSTLVDTISGFLDYGGSLTYRGTEVRERETAELVNEGVIYCTESRNLFPFMSVEDNLELGAYRHADGMDDRLDFVYDLFPTLKERTDQEAGTMSGGEQQMLAIGRSLMGDPDLLILDEPTIGLAPVIIDDISDTIEEILDRGITILLAEQNVTFAMDHADRIYLLENGTVQREGDPESFEGDEEIQEVYLGG